MIFGGRRNRVWLTNSTRLEPYDDVLTLILERCIETRILCRLLSGGVSLALPRLQRPRQARRVRVSLRAKTREESQEVQAVEPGPTCVSSVECDRGELGVLWLRGAQSRDVLSMNTVDDGARPCHLKCLGALWASHEDSLIVVSYFDLPYSKLYSEIIREGSGRLTVSRVDLAVSWGGLSNEYGARTAWCFVSSENACSGFPLVLTALPCPLEHSSRIKGRPDQSTRDGRAQWSMEARSRRYGGRNVYQGMYVCIVPVK